MSMLIYTQEIQDLFQDINLDRPAKWRKLVGSISLDSATRMEGSNSSQLLPSKRPLEDHCIESDRFSPSDLVPIGIVGFDPLLSSPTIHFCTKLFPCDSGLKHFRPVAHFEHFERTKLQFTQRLGGGSIPVRSDLVRGCIAWDSHSTPGQLIPWSHRILDCSITIYLDDILVQFSWKKAAKSQSRFI
jgi:hypothetical protein